MKDKKIDEFFDAAKAEVKAALAKHGEFNSLHEAYGVLKEEVDEFWDEVKKKPENRSSSDVYAELVQVAAMAAKSSLCLRSKP